MDNEKLIELLNDKEFFNSVCRELTRSELMCLALGLKAFKSKAEEIYSSHTVDLD